MQIEKRCDNCCFSTFAFGLDRAVLICRSRKGSEGSWKICQLDQRCSNFYPRRSASLAKRPRLIPLTRGKFAIVDAEDYGRLARFMWFAKGGGRHVYAVRKDKEKVIKMHRYIMDAPGHLVVDHIDHNGLNNQKHNLRLATYAQNSRNQKKNAKGTSKYKGVCWSKRYEKWAVQITANRRSYHLGYFDNEIQAAKAYDRAAKKLHKSFASLNFPQIENSQ